MNGLDLFSGIGGIGIALEPWVRTVAYCERDRYAQGVLLSRMQSGEIDRAPIWDDVTTIRADMLPRIDIISGGFPCQDISVAGHGKGLDGERSGLFFEIVRLIRECNPRFVFLENVPAIRTRGGERVVKELASIGYDCRWTTLSAASVGAPHKRERWFLLAHTKNIRRDGRCDEHRANEKNRPREIAASRICSTQPLADSMCKGLEGQREEPGRTRAELKDACNNSWWKVEPSVGGTFDGLSPWMDGSGGSDNADEAEEVAKEILRKLQCGFGTKTLWQETRGLECVSAEEALLAFVRKYENDCWEAWEFLESENPSEECLRALRIKEESSCPSLQRGQVEQFFREHTNFMRSLSHLVASRGKTPWDSPLWESTVERVTNNMPYRAERLKCLGNSVVPAQVKKAFKKLAGIN
jgi:DNA (cytosine-5)-methyltransferase 1